MQPRGAQLLEVPISPYLSTHAPNHPFAHLPILLFNYPTVDLRCYLLEAFFAVAVDLSAAVCASLLWSVCIYCQSRNSVLRASGLYLTARVAPPSSLQDLPRMLS